MHSATRCAAISFLEVSTTFQYSRKTEWQHGRHCQGIIFYQILISQHAGTDVYAATAGGKWYGKHFSFIFFCWGFAYIILHFFLNAEEHICPSKSLAARTSNNILESWPLLLTGKFRKSVPLYTLLDIS